MENKVCKDCNIALKEELAQNIPMVMLGRKFILPFGRIWRCPDCKNISFDRADVPGWQEIFFQTLICKTIDAAFEARPPRKKERPLIRQRVYKYLNEIFPKEQK